MNKIDCKISYLNWYDAGKDATQNKDDLVHINSSSREIKTSSQVQPLKCISPITSRS